MKKNRQMEIKDTQQKSPKGKNINIRKMLQKLISITGKTFMKNI